MKFKLLEEYLVENDLPNEKHDPRTCPKCAKQLGIPLQKPDEKNQPAQKEVSNKTPNKKEQPKKVIAKKKNESLEEDFVYDLEPGVDYYFMHNNHLTKGKFKYKTKAWQVFEREDGEEVRINAWSNVATTPEDIIGVEQVVDRLEKDTKVPNVLHLPNRFVKLGERV